MKNLNTVDSVPISAFIFHTSRCGSTLFAKALAREPANLLSIQPGPLQHGFWAAVTDGFRKPLLADEGNLTAFRKLLSLLVRRRNPTHDRAFVKFISWNVLYIDFIMKAFPDVPAIFLYRDPIEIIASVRESSTAILEAKDRKQAEFLTGISRGKIDRLGATGYLATCYRQSFSTVMAWPDQRLSLLEYPALTSERFPQILDRGLGYRPTDASVENMLQQFATYSKDDSDNKSFSTDREAKREAISEKDRHIISIITGTALEELRRDPRNLFASPSSDARWPEGRTRALRQRDHTPPSSKRAS